MIMSWLDELFVPVDLEVNTIKDVIVDAVIKEMKIDIQNGDWSAIDDLLHQLPEESLINYLPK